MYLTLTKNFIYILIFFSIFSNINLHSSNKKGLYSKQNISNYFSGIVSSNNNNNKLSLKYLNNLKHLKNDHGQFNRELVFSLVQSQKITEVFSYLKKINIENRNFFHAHLLLGISYLLEEKFIKSKSYFNLIIKNKNFSNFEKLTAQILLGYVKIFENPTHNYTTAFNDIPNNYKSFVLINEALVNCYLNNSRVDESFLNLTQSERFNFTRYNFFYVNYLFSKNRKKELSDILEKNTDIINNNLLLEQTKLWVNDGKSNKIKEVFDCQKTNHLIGEFFYLIANLFSSEKNFVLSNFFLNLSLYLNPDFIFNNVLLAENYYYMEDYENSKNIYLKFDRKNIAYKWHANKRIVWIKSKIESEESAIIYLNKSLNSLKNPTIQNYFDVANFYRDFKKYKKSINYYTKVLNNINSSHQLYPKILHRRGMSYERLKLWKKSENDLMQSLTLAPNEPYVLNYLAYSWLERNINFEKSIEMLEVAFNQEKNDPYIIDSLGWGMYLTGKYEKAEKLLQRAVMLMPLDPVVNDHYADILWKLNKSLQANYFWNYVLNLETTEEEMKGKIREKLISGIKNNS